MNIYKWNSYCKPINYLLICYIRYVARLLLIWNELNKTQTDAAVLLCKKKNQQPSPNFNPNPKPNLNPDNFD